MADAFDPYYEWLGIPPAEQPPSHYRLLGIELFEENAGVIANAADRQMGHLRGFAAGKHSQLSQRLLNEVAAARVCLLNSDKKADYDEQLRQCIAPASPVPRAVPVAPAVAASQPSAIPAAAPRVPHEAAEREYESGLPPFVLPMASAFGLLVLAAIVWWLSGLGGNPQEVAEGQQSGAEQNAGHPEIKPAVQPEDPESEDSKPGVSISAVPSDPQPAQPTESPSQPATPAMSDPAEPSATVETPDVTESPPDTTQEPMPVEPPVEEPAASPSPDVAQTPEVSDLPGSTADLSAEPSPLRPAETGRKPVPDRDAQQKVRQMVDETYDTGAARSAAERVALVEQLAALVEKTEDSTERFVLLRCAAELATEAGEGKRMMQLVSQIAEEFEVDRLRVFAAMLDGYSKKVENEEQIGVLVQSSAPVIDEAIAVGRIDLADSLSAAVYRACQLAPGRAYRAEALGRRRKVQELRAQWDAMQAASAKLQANPNDAESHTVLGRWLCFTQGDWQQGLPHLAQGTDAELKDLAARELNAATIDASEQVALADGWWGVAETADPKVKGAILNHAADWYKQAEPQLTSTLLKVKVAKRLEELAQKIEAETPQSAKKPPLAVAPFTAEQATQHQQAWAKYLNVQVEQVNPIGMKLCLIPPGQFMMGTADQDATIHMSGRLSRSSSIRLSRHRYESPQHVARITRPFWMSATEVTQNQYFRVMGSNPSSTRMPNHPVDRVGWLEAAEFCRRLTQTLGKKAGERVYRLPTEAEWEYACRAGSTTDYCFGDDEAMLPEFAWFSQNAGGQFQPVGTRRPNQWGLYDMHGNAREWVFDWSSSSFYAEAPVEDPAGPPTGYYHVARSGSVSTYHADCRSASRSMSMQPSGSYHLGFRVVLAEPISPDKLMATGADGNQPSDSGSTPPGSEEGASRTPSAEGMLVPQPTEGTFDHLRRRPRTEESEP